MGQAANPRCRACGWPNRETIRHRRLPPAIATAKGFDRRFAAGAPLSSNASAHLKSCPDARYRAAISLAMVEMNVLEVGPRSMTTRCNSADGDEVQDAVLTEVTRTRCSISRGGMTHGPRNIQRFLEVLSVDRRGLALVFTRHIVVNGEYHQAYKKWLMRHTRHCSINVKICM